jgi:hypothetical protein
MQLDEHVVMPNHFHGIIHVVGAPLLGTPKVAGTKPVTDVGAPLVGALERAGTTPAPTLGAAVGAFKSLTTDEYIMGVHRLGWPRFRSHFWQRNYHDHVIRHPDELEKIREYVRQNPLRWTCDRYNPENTVLVVDETGCLVPWNET